MAGVMALERPGRVRRGMLAAAGGLALLALLGGIAWVLPGALDWSRYRGALARYAAAELGRPVRIDGQISVVLLPAPVVVAGSVRLGDRGDGIALTAPALRLRLAFAPLLIGRVVPRELVLSRPVITLPWPLPPAALASDRPDWLSASSARIEGGTLNLGPLQLLDVNATVASGGPELGGLLVRGEARSLGRRWRFSDRLGIADTQGDAPFDASLDAQTELANGVAAPQDAGGHLVGTLMRDGSLTARLTAHAADLSRLMPAPPVAMAAEGIVGLGRGPARADLAITVGGVAVAARLQPAGPDRTQAQVLSLATGRLDLDAWDAALAKLRAGRVARQTGPGGATRQAIRLPWPVSLELSADAVQLRGGLIRAAHAALALDGSRAVVRSASAILPGEAAVTLTGTLVETGGLTLSGDGTLDAPQLRGTLRWLAGCGLRLGPDLPPDVLREAKFGFHVTAGPGRVDLNALRGSIEQDTLGGRIGVDTATGAVDADLTLDRLRLDNWLPSGRLPAWAVFSRSLADVTMALKLHASQVWFRGTRIDAVALDAATDAGGLAVGSAGFDLDGLHGSFSGTIGGDGLVSGAVFDLGAAEATALARHLPGWARFTDFLWSGPVRLHAEANGPADAMLASIGIDLADARLDAHPTIDTTTGAWRAQLTLRHPGAPRLLGALGLADARNWLGEGSLSLLAQLSGEPGVLRADSFDLTAATLHATGHLNLAPGTGAAAPLLTGQIVADTLPLPPYSPNGRSPAPTGWLAGWNAKLGLSADQLDVGDAAVAHRVAGSIELQGGMLRFNGFTASLGGGAMTGHASVDTAATPPRVAVQATIAGAALGQALFGTPLDLGAGLIDATLSLTAHGYSPAALLASVAGTVHVAATAGRVVGFDLAPVRRAGPAAAALGVGETRFDRLTGDIALSAGTATASRLDLDGPAGAVRVRGTVDLAGGSLNLLAALPGDIDVRITGPVQAPRRIIEGAGR